LFSLISRAWEVFAGFIPRPTVPFARSILRSRRFKLTAGRLAGLTAKLAVRPEEATYFDPKEKRKRSTTIWALSLEVEGEDMRKLVSNLTANVRVFAESRKLLGDGQVLKVIEEGKSTSPGVCDGVLPR
jgi:hypothetical protein